MNSQKLTLIGAAVFAFLFIIVLFLFALNGRYLIESSGSRIVVYDKWTGKHFYTIAEQREANLTDRAMYKESVYEQYDPLKARGYKSPAEKRAETIKEKVAVELDDSDPWSRREQEVAVSPIDAQSNYAELDRINQKEIDYPDGKWENHNHNQEISNSSRKGLNAFLEGAAGFILIALIVLLYRFVRQKYKGRNQGKE